MRAVLYERNGMMMDTSKECEDKRRERDDTMPTDAELLSRIEAIALEGDDGCGKSTVLSLLSRRLRDDYGIDVMTVREPGGNLICESIRNMILSDDSEGMCSTTEAMLYAASRYQLLHDVVRPALDAGKMVAKRFSDSSRQMRTPSLTAKGQTPPMQPATRRATPATGCSTCSTR